MYQLSVTYELKKMRVWFSFFFFQVLSVVPHIGWSELVKQINSYKDNDLQKSYYSCVNSGVSRFGLFIFVSRFFPE